MVPDPNRVQTRAKNATTHPGKVVNDVLAVRRRPEEIETEKQVRKQRRQGREQKEANMRTAVLEVAEYEDRMAVEDMDRKASFPRHNAKSEFIV